MGRAEFARRAFAMTGSFKQCRIMTPGEAKCLFLLQENLTDIDDIPTIKLARKRMGCTCDECIDGYLSLNMRICLLRHAQVAYEALSDTCELGVNDLLHKFGFCVDRTQHEKVVFKNILHTIVKHLEGGIAPSIHNIQKSILDECEGHVAEEMRSRDDSFARSTTKRALIAVCRFTAEGNKMTGTGFAKVFLDQPKCRSCRNDVEYDFVQRMLLSRRGHLATTQSL